jgi:chemotaxis protein histidine kinase CheA
MDDLVSDFVLEAAETLAGLQSGVCTLTLGQADADTIPEMLRRLHGLKGMCGFIGLPRAEAAAHSAEELLMVAQKAPDVPDAITYRMIGQLIGRLGEMISQAAQQHIAQEGDDLRAASALEALGAGAQSAAPMERRARAPWCGLDTLATALGDRLGKRIHLRIGGDDARIDLTAAPAIRTALIALVRNACDHGVESPAERRDLGKSSLAVVHLRVRHTQNGLAIDMMDDGRGVDPQKVRKSFVALGAGDAASAAALSDAVVQDLVFTPGLSTAQTMTPLSGRGLGLDLAAREVERLGGRIEMDSTPGQGCRFTLVLPRTVLAGPQAHRRAAA